MKVSQAMHRDLLFCKESYDKRRELKEGSSWTNLKCRSGLYVDDIFVLGTDKRKVMRTYDCVWGAFEQVRLPYKLLKS